MVSDAVAFLSSEFTEDTRVRVMADLLRIHASIDEVRDTLALRFLV